MESRRQAHIARQQQMLAAAGLTDADTDFLGRLDHPSTVTFAADPLPAAEQQGTQSQNQEAANAVGDFINNLILAVVHASTQSATSLPQPGERQTLDQPDLVASEQLDLLSNKSPRGSFSLSFEPEDSVNHKPSTRLPPAQGTRTRSGPTDSDDVTTSSDSDSSTPVSPTIDRPALDFTASPKRSQSSIAVVAEVCSEHIVQAIQSGASEVPMQTTQHEGVSSEHTSTDSQSLDSSDESFSSAEAENHNDDSAHRQEMAADVDASQQSDVLGDRKASVAEALAQLPFAVIESPAKLSDPDIVARAADDVVQLRLSQSDTSSSVSDGSVRASPVLELAKAQSKDHVDVGDDCVLTTTQENVEAILKVCQFVNRVYRANDFHRHSPAAW